MNLLQSIERRVVKHDPHLPPGHARRRAAFVQVATSAARRAVVEPGD